MSETQQSKVGAYVAENQPLHYLYILGTIGIIGGLAIAVIAAFNMSSYGGVNSAAVAWATIGGGVASLGTLAVIGGAVAHAINWQILNR
ncbi:hypothetical protein [Leifsonia sp. Le1]|uniref:hypothetical protein n=1 Tax=Leifsonia sp. Le1 TaxID=3404918 RepID=UPI003EBC750B